MENQELGKPCWQRLVLLFKEITIFILLFSAFHMFMFSNIIYFYFKVAFICDRLFLVLFGTLVITCCRYMYTSNVGNMCRLHILFMV